MLRKKTARFLAGAAALGALLTGCGGDDAGHGDMPAMGEGKATTAEQAAANEADIAFAQQMIPHHAQAIDMAGLVPSRAADKKVVDLAKQIEQAQDPEIQKLTGWLKDWGAPASGDGMDHGENGHSEMAGMMSEGDMAKLQKAKGAEFDTMWMRMMIKHHEGAVEMARAELKDGSHGDAKAMAQEIIDGQQAEIDTMKGLLGEN